MYDDSFVTGSSFNRHVNLDNIEWKIIEELIQSHSKYAQYLWKILKYNTQDCLSKPNLTEEEKRSLIFTDNANATNARVFMSPYVDDAWEEQSAHLHIYVHSITPKNNITSTVNIGFECIVHNKIAIIDGEYNMYNDQSNPVEGKDGEKFIAYKNRATEMLKNVIAALNGRMVNGVGVLQFNNSLSPYDASKASLWNNRKFFGHTIIMSTLLSGVSGCDNCGD